MTDKAQTLHWSLPVPGDASGWADVLIAYVSEQGHGANIIQCRLKRAGTVQANG